MASIPSYAINLENFINHLPGNHYLKDLNSKYLACNDNMAKIMALSDKEYLLGQSDLNQPWEEYAEVYQKNDRKIITTKKSYNFIHPIISYHGEKKLLLNKKSPVFDNNENVTSILGTDLVIKCKKATDLFIEFHQMDIDMALLSSVFEQYIMVNDYAEFGLTNREGQCLFYLIRGKTIKEIANTLFISPRTVESHVVNIKNKLNCTTKSDLFDKALQLGFVSIVPASFMKDLFA